MSYIVKSPQSISPSYTLKRVALSLFTLMLLLFLFLLFTPWQQTFFGYGSVIAYSPGERQQVISAPVSGRLAKWYVNEGSKVKKGDKIVYIADQDPQLLEHLKLEKVAIENKLEAIKKSIEWATIQVERQHKLYKEGISSRRKFEIAKFDLAAHARNKAAIEYELVEMAVKIARVRSQMVLAPIDGTIIRRLSGGNSVLTKVGDPLAELVPDTQSRAVELWINGNDMPLIQTGNEVVLLFEGWPAIQISGWPSLAINTFLGNIAVIDSAANKDGFFRLLILPKKNAEWPGLRYLRQGVRVHGWVQLKQVPLWYELWRRFNAFPPMTKGKITMMKT